MRLFALTRKAENDLRAIARYTEGTWGVAQRNRYLKQFDDYCFVIFGPIWTT